MGHRRITDAAMAKQPRKELSRLAAVYRPGDSDLAWTRLTIWRGLLAATLDQAPYEKVDHVTVSGASDSPSTDLLAGWLAESLRCPVLRTRTTAGTGMSSVRMERRSGNIDLVRADSPVATLLQPGQPERRIGLHRRGIAERLAPQLRRLETDAIYEAALTEGLDALAHTKTKTESAAIAEGRHPRWPRTRRTSPRPSDPRARPPGRPSGPSPRPSRRRRGNRFEAGRGEASRRKAARPGQAGREALSPSPMVVVHRDAQLLAQAGAARLVTRLVDVQSARGSASVVLTGGGMGPALLAALAASPARDAVDWSRLDLWWGDERFLPQGSGPQRHPEPGRPARPGAPGPGPGARDARPRRPGRRRRGCGGRVVRRCPGRAAGGGDPTPVFDVLMLGVGPDAHVASLFPEAPALDETERTAVGVRNSPKPPPTRISLTMPGCGGPRTCGSWSPARTRPTPSGWRCPGRRAAGTGRRASGSRPPCGWSTGPRPGRTPGPDPPLSP